MSHRPNTNSQSLAPVAGARRGPTHDHNSAFVPICSFGDNMLKGNQQEAMDLLMEAMTIKLAATYDGA